MGRSGCSGCLGCLGLIFIVFLFFGCVGMMVDTSDDEEVNKTDRTINKNIKSLKQEDSGKGNNSEFKSFKKEVENTIENKGYIVDRVIFGDNGPKMKYVVVSYVRDVGLSENIFERHARLDISEITKILEKYNIKYDELSLNIAIGDSVDNRVWALKVRMTPEQVKEVSKLSEYDVMHRMRGYVNDYYIVNQLHSEEG